MNLRMVCRMFVWCSLCVSMLTVSNTLRRVEICGILFVMYGSSIFSIFFAITERSEMGLYDVHMFLFGFGSGIGMMLIVSMCEG